MEVRYSGNRRSFIEDGFVVNININNKQNKLSFQSSVTVDHVKYEIVKQFYPNEQSQDYFLALNKNEILQIEFVKFIFAHEEIQKSLLIKKSIDVFLVPKSKEIIARKSKAESIKKQLGTFTKKSMAKQAPPSLKRAPSQKNILEQQQKLNKTNNTSSTSSSSSSSNNNSNNNTTSTISSSPNNSLSTTPTTISPSVSQNDLSTSPSSRGQLEDSQDDATTELIKLQLQQQLILLEDEELKYQSNLASGDQYTESEAEDDPSASESEKDIKSESESESNTIFSLSPQQSNHLQFKKEPIIAKPESPSLQREYTSKDEIKIKPSLPSASLSPTTATTLVDDNQKEKEIIPQSPSTSINEIEEVLHWTNFLQMKSLKPNLNEIPVQIQVQNNNIVIGCNKDFTSNEFKSYLISTLESMIQGIKVGTFSTNDLTSSTIAFKSNTVIYDQFKDNVTTTKPNSIPQIVVLKPGLQDLYKSSNHLNNGLEVGSPSQRHGLLSSSSSILNYQSPLLVSSSLSNSINSSNGGMNNSNSIGSMGGSSLNLLKGRQGGLVGSSDRLRNLNFSLGEQRDHNAKAIQQKKKLTSAQIASLLGKPLNWSNTENEIRYFRNLAEQIFDFDTLDSRDRVKITIAPITQAPADPLLPSNFRVKCYLPPDNHSTTINIMTTDTISDLIEKIITKHNTSTKLISSDHTGKDYVIRITGTSDHVLNTEILVTNLVTVRNRLQRKKDIKFSLVHKSSLPKIYIDGFSDEICTLKEVSQSIISSSPSTTTSYGSMPNQSFINFGSNNQQQQQQQNPISPRQNNFLENKLSSMGNNAANHIVQINGNRSILFNEINRPFEIRIICLENFNPTIFQKFIPDSNLNDIKLTISVSLCHGEELLTDPMETTIKGSNPLWCEWLRSALLMSDIPRATKLCFTVYAQVGDKNKVSIGWADLQLIDYHGQLLSGVISLILWPGDRVDIPDFNIPSPSLVIEFCQFPFPVVFPKPERMERTEIRDYVEARKEDQERLDELIQKDPLYSLTESDKKFIWMYRMHLQTIPSSLPKVLQSLHWNNPSEVREAHRLLSIWSPLSPLEALELLDVKFADELVREYAVKCLNALTDSDLALYLLQLVQSIKHEPYHDSALARFLIQRALNNRAIIGHPFFWHLEAEMHNPKISERYSLVLETYLKGCGNQRHEFVKQMEVVTKLQSIAKMVKESPPNKRKSVLHEELSKVVWPNTFHLPTSPSTESCGIIVSECRWLDSFTVPLYLVFQNVDPVGEPIPVIFKTGDDLRQDILTLQMISVMDNIWKQNGLDLHLSIYNVTAISEDTGFIEVVPDADTTANIQKAAGGATAAFTKTPLSNWLRERNQQSIDHDYAVQNFTHSLAGYCVATYILGISDRHNDNIMVSNSGHLFHIDFAHFLGNIMKFHGYKREKAPFVLTPEFAHVMGGEKSQSFKFFTDLCCLSFKFIRKFKNLFIILFCLMISTGIPELSTKEDISYVKEAFFMEVNDEEAANSFSKLIQKSLKSTSTQLMFALHILLNPDKND